jgi:hypothetical protein
MEQRVEIPNGDDLARIERQRDWVRGHFEPTSQQLYEEYDQKLRLLDTILQNKWIDPSETLKLQSLGITLGDAFVQRCGFEWVAVEDEHGRDPALRVPDTTIILYPLTMISKRIEAGESVDVYALIDGVARKVDEVRTRFPKP